MVLKMRLKHLVRYHFIKNTRAQTALDNCKNCVLILELRREAESLDATPATEFLFRKDGLSSIPSDETLQIWVH